MYCGEASGGSGGGTTDDVDDVDDVWDDGWLELLLRTAAIAAAEDGEDADALAARRDVNSWRTDCRCCELMTSCLTASTMARDSCAWSCSMASCMTSVWMLGAASRCTSFGGSAVRLLRTIMRSRCGAPCRKWGL